MTNPHTSFDLSVVIPCYNEASRLPRTLDHTIRFLEQQKGTFEVIVVSDGSKDNTRHLAEEIFESLPNHIQGRAIEYTPNAGKGKAVKVGMCEARGKRILFMDADYAVPLEDLTPAKSLLDGGIDIAIGSRALEDTTIVEHQSFIRERLAKLFGLMQRNYLGLKIKDTQCGFKLFTREAAHRVFAQVKLTSVIFDGEMLWLAKRMNFSVKEFPVEWTHDPDTRITYNLWRSIKVFLDMLVIPFIHIDRRTWNK